MGLVTKAVAQTDITVLQSIARETVNTIIDRTGFPADSEIIFTDDFVDSKRNRLNLFSQCYDEKGIVTKYGNFVFVEVEDQFTEEGLLRNRHGIRPHSAFFNDPKLGIRMFPIYCESEMKLNIRFRSNSKTFLTNWINALRIRESAIDILIRSHIRYDYAIPHRFIEFLYKAWEMREANHGYGQDFADYCNEHFGEGYMIRSNSAMQDHELIMNERQMHTRGWVDEKMFYNARTIEDGIYEVVMPYSFRYQKITGVTLDYPALVHNNFIPNEYAQEFLHPLIKELREKYTRPLTYAGEHLLGPDETFIYLGDGGARMIDWDPWFPENHIKEYQTVLIFPFAVDEADDTLVCNLNELPEEYLPAGIKEYIVKYKDNWYVPNSMLCRIEVHGVSDEEVPHRVYIDEDYNIRTRDSLNPRDRNYVRIGIQRDFARLNPVHTRALLKDPEIFVPLLRLYNPETIFTDNVDEFRDYMPKEPVLDDLQGLKPMIVSLPDNRGITDRSYLYWLRMQADTNEAFKNIRLTSSLGVATNNITVKRRA
ncbi:hypothetical protein [Vibrio phage BONAISHI]|nr:hypothetical protein [Vibrio phage BONAISHI]